MPDSNLSKHLTGFALKLAFVTAACFVGFFFFKSLGQPSGIAIIPTLAFALNAGSIFGKSEQRQATTAERVRFANVAALVVGLFAVIPLLTLSTGWYTGRAIIYYIEAMFFALPDSRLNFNTLALLAAGAVALAWLLTYVCVGFASARQAKR